MKKNLIVGLAFIYGIALVISCSSSNKDDNNGTETDDSTNGETVTNVVEISDSNSGFEVITIDASRKEVWQMLSNILFIPYYYSYATEAKFVSDIHEGVGAARQTRFLDGGLLTETITAWDKGKGFTISSIPTDSLGNETMITWPFKSMVNIYTLKKKGKQTSLEVRANWEFLDPNLPPRMAAGTVEQMTWVCEDIANGIKKYIETGQPQTLIEKKENIARRAKVIESRMAEDTITGIENARELEMK